MTDQEINEKLAKVMGWKHNKATMKYEDRSGLIDSWTRPDGTTVYRPFSYKDPAIRCECEDWLLDNGYELSTNTTGDYCTTRDEIGDFTAPVCNKDPYKAIALARIAAAGE